jgi:NAD(P)-dependent dehydrogenase (short-subunit alcohol dehydrogenase family)
MDMQGRVVLVTGGASGIGRALCHRFAQAGAAAVVVADLDGAGAERVAAEVGGLGLAVNVAVEAEVQHLVQVAIQHLGHVDVMCSNAGIMVRKGIEAGNDEWQHIFDVNVMAHVYAARAVLPQMLARGQGYLMNTASAAGLLSQVDAAPYAVTKHAAVAFAEWLALTYGDRGIRVSCLCPQGVLTPMLFGMNDEGGSFLTPGAVSPEQVADDVMQAMAAETFLILPHPEVHDYLQRKAEDIDRWLRGMRRLRAKIEAETIPPN